MIKILKYFLAQDQAFNIAFMKLKLKIWVKKAVETQVKYYNAKNQQQKYNVEDKIFLNS